MKIPTIRMGVLCTLLKLLRREEKAVKKHLTKLCLLFMIATLLVPGSIFAYSYGDPTKEDVAETFNLIKIKLSSSPEDWSAAHEAYKVRRAEISSHFGEPIAVTLDHNFEMKEKDLVIQNYRYVLYLNLKRRFDFAEKDLNDYGKVKVLLGKAKGTFDVLRPYVESKLPNEMNKLDMAFEEALKAIGNPGLFGMGKEPVEPEKFKKQTTYILTTLKPLFTYTAYTPKQPESTTEQSKEDQQSTTEKQKTTTKEQTKETNVDNQTDTKQDTKTSDQKTESTEKQTAKQDTSTTKETTSTSTSSEQDSDKEVEETVEKSAENKTTGEKEESVTEEESKENVTEEDKTATKTEEETKEAEQTDDSTQKEESTDKQVASASAEHAPMDQTKKTNPVLTFLIIAGVVTLLAGSIWFARKKNFI